MSDDRIRELFDCNAEDIAEVGSSLVPAMTAADFAAALREALAEDTDSRIEVLKAQRDCFSVSLKSADKQVADLRKELAEAVRLLSYLIQQIPGTGDCRAAARFVAEHGKKEA